MASATIQAIIDNAKTNGVIAQLPSKDTACEVMIARGNQEGLVIQGTGRSQPIDWPQPFADEISRLIATGADRANQVLFRLDGAEAHLKDFGLDGGSRAEQYAAIPGPKCGVGLQITKTGEGLATGGVYSDHNEFSWHLVAVQIGTSRDEANCERCLFKKSLFYNNDVGVQINNIQGMLHVFEQPEFFNTQVCFEVKAGGRLFIRDPFMVTPNQTLLKLDPFDDTCIAQNNGSYYVENVVGDEVAEQSVLLDMTPGFNYWADIVFQRGHLQFEEYATPAFNVSGSTSLTIRDFYGIQPGMIRVTNTDPATVTRILVENCRFMQSVSSPFDIIDVAGSTGRFYVTVRDLYGFPTQAVRRPVNLSRLFTGGIPL